MKKLLSIIWTISLVGIISIISLVACNKPPQYNEDELIQLKEKNNIKIKMVF